MGSEKFIGVDACKCLCLLIIFLNSYSTLAQESAPATSTTEAPKPSTTSEPQNKTTLIYTHVTVSADTTEYEKVSLRPFPGNYQRPDMGTSRTLTSALSYGLLPRVEVGTIPILYFIDRKTINFTTKFNLFRTDTISIGTAFTYIDVDYRNPQTEIDLSAERAHLQTLFWSWMLNVRPLGSRWSYAITSILNPTKIKSDNTRREMLLDNRVDVSRRMTKDLYLTGGISATESPDFFSRFESNGYLGFGASVTWVRPRKFFSAPAFGLHYYPNYRGRAHTEWIFTTTFM